MRIRILQILGVFLQMRLILYIEVQRKNFLADYFFSISSLRIFALLSRVRSVGKKNRIEALLQINVKSYSKNFKHLKIICCRIYHFSCYIFNKERNKYYFQMLFTTWYSRVEWSSGAEKLPQHKSHFEHFLPETSLFVSIQKEIMLGKYGGGGGIGRIK